MVKRLGREFIGDDVVQSPRRYSFSLYLAALAPLVLSVQVPRTAFGSGVERFGSCSKSKEQRLFGWLALHIRTLASSSRGSLVFHAGTEASVIAIVERLITLLCMGDWIFRSFSLAYVVCRRFD